MNVILRLILGSLWSRRYTLGLTLFALGLSSALLVGIERLQQDVRASFAQSVSGTDLLVGARGSALQLMLHSVFRLGEPAGTLSWGSARKLAEHPAVAWTIPLALGDSHRGYPVVGTEAGFFTHFRHGYGKTLVMADGQAFNGLFDAVLGAEVAKRLGYRVGDRIILAHGSGAGGVAEHGDKPFVVSGILRPTGTPVDRSVHISLEAMEAIHLDWQGGAPIPGVSIPADFVRKFDLTPKAVDAVLVGLKSRAAVFSVQREIGLWTAEPLTAVLPAVALEELWRLLDKGERALQLVSALALISGLAGMVAVVLAGLEQRRRELAILRAIGASLGHVFSLLILEGFVLGAFGAVAGVLMHGACVLAASGWVESHYGIALSIFSASRDEMALLAAISLAGGMAGLIPACRAYRISLNDGLTPSH